MTRELSVGLVAITLLLGGCQASFKAGGGNEPAAPAPPPPPAPTAAPAPAPEPEKKPEAPPPVVKKSTAKVEGASVKIPGNIVFETGKATLMPNSGSEVVLEQLKLYLDENPRVSKLRIEGHTDNVGKAEDNMKLSGERARTIKQWLIDHGVAKERLLSVGFGMTKPIADNSTDAGKAQNRRTEFKIAELDGKRYMGMDPAGGGTVFE
jgi:OOP family OmpA-OmpF porin